MILNKSNLVIVDLVKVDVGVPVLNNIHVRKDGTSVASNGRAVVAVSPVGSEVKGKLPLEESRLKEGSEGITISAEFIREVLKNMPKDTMFGGLLEHCDIDRSGAVRLNDGKRQRLLKGRLYDRDYVGFEEVFSRKRSGGVRVVVNLKRLLLMLSVISKVCPDSSEETPVFLEFTEQNDIVVRAENRKTGQRVIGIAKSYKSVEGKWLKSNLWEKLLGIVNKRVSKKLKK